MTEDILINITPFETRAAIIHQGVIQDLHLERSAHKGYVGNIYLGKVIRVLPGMQSAFVDIGLERSAFLHIADIKTARNEQLNGNPITPIEKLLFEGQTLMVQVTKDPVNNKGARLSTQISLAGRLLVHIPHDEHIGISQRIDNETERERLKQLVESNKPTDSIGGYIIRTQAEAASATDIQADIDYLNKLWASVQQLARRSGAPSLIYQDIGLATRVLRDLVTHDTQHIHVDHPTAIQELKQWASVFNPSVVDRLLLYSGERPLFDLYQVDEAIHQGLHRRVKLKSGGYLIIDQTEALTTIDVNTGGYVGGRNFDDTIFKTNLEATQVIARQLRLRNLGGMILIDFIDMENLEHQQIVLAELAKATERDRSRVTIHGFTHLGLVEVTRKRTRDSLTQCLCEPCPTCDNRGRVQTPRTICYEILREIQREAQQFNPKEFRVIAPPQVIDLFLDEESQHLAQLGDLIAKPITLQADHSYKHEQYDIILL